MTDQPLGFQPYEIQTGSSTHSARLKLVIVADMPFVAQGTRVYDEYLAQFAGSSPDQIAYAAVSLVGPRKRLDRIVGSLKLLS